MSYADAVERNIARSFPPYTDLRRHVDELFANNYAGLQAEFAALSEFEQALMLEPGLFQTARHPYNQDRNRWPDILANEPTRVRLHVPPGQSDYINANVIDGAPFGLHVKYIAAQAPLPNTVEHWWAMIWGMQVGLIVMLANPVERGENKVHPYWPQEVGRHAAIRIGPFVVGMTAKAPDPTHPTLLHRTLAVHCDGASEARLIELYHFTAWADHDVPASTAPLLHLLSLIETHKRAGPVLVHCSAGVGRTGVIVTAHAVLNLLKRHAQVSRGPFQFNVLGTLCYLRRCRNRLIQTPEQLGLCYHLILEVVESGRMQSLMPGSPASPAKMAGTFSPTHQRPSSPPAPPLPGTYATYARPPPSGPDPQTYAASPSDPRRRSASETPLHRAPHPRGSSQPPPPHATVTTYTRPA